MTWQLAYTLFVGLMLLAGLVASIIGLTKVVEYRKPIYWLNISVSVALLVTFGLGVARQFGVTTPPNTILYALEFALFLVALLLIVVPLVDREEARLLHKEHPTVEAG